MIHVLRHNPSLKKASDSIATLRNMQRELQSTTPKKEPLKEVVLSVKKGDYVTHTALGEGCLVVELLRKKKVRIVKNGMHMDVPIKDILEKTKQIYLESNLNYYYK